MSGISITIDAADLDGIFKKLRPIFDFDAEELMTAIAARGDKQTRERIEQEKTAPDGTPWKPNIEGTSILQRSGTNLLYQSAFRASADEAEWGNTWEYAHVHQDGAVIVPKEKDALSFKIGGKYVTAQKVTIPARPFLGISAENEREIIELVTDHFGLLP